MWHLINCSDVDPSCQWKMQTGAPRKKEIVSEWRPPSSYELLSLVTVSPSRSELISLHLRSVFYYCYSTNVAPLKPRLAESYLSAGSIHTQLTDGRCVTAHLLAHSRKRLSALLQFYRPFYTCSKTSQSGRGLSSSQRCQLATSARMYGSVMCECACEPSLVEKKKEAEWSLCAVWTPCSSSLFALPEHYGDWSGLLTMPGSPPFALFWISIRIPLRSRKD